MPFSFRQRSFLITALTILSVGPSSARPARVHWEKIHVYHLTPSAVFAKLGLTHSTKNGHTRDGKQGVPDPTFPPGLTDVVPSDLDKMLLVRGTTGGLTLFRSRVAAADTPAVPLRLHAELAQRQETGEIAFGTADQDGLADGIPAQISLGDGNTARVYQITTRANRDGSLWVACRISLPLPPASAAPVDGAKPEAVFVPIRVWTDPLSRKIAPGQIAVFQDFAAFRHAAGRRLGSTGIDTNDDYTLSVSLSPMPDPLTPNRF